MTSLSKLFQPTNRSDAIQDQLNKLLSKQAAVGTNDDPVQLKPVNSNDVGTMVRSALRNANTTARQRLTLSQEVSRIRLTKTNTLAGLEAGINSLRNATAKDLRSTETALRTKFDTRDQINNKIRLASVVATKMFNQSISAYNNEQSKRHKELAVKYSLLASQIDQKQQQLKHFSSLNRQQLSGQSRAGLRAQDSNSSTNSIVGGLIGGLIGVTRAFAMTPLGRAILGAAALGTAGKALYDRWSKLENPALPGNDETMWPSFLGGDKEKYDKYMKRREEEYEQSSREKRFNLEQQRNERQRRENQEIERHRLRRENAERERQQQSNAVANRWDRTGNSYRDLINQRSADRLERQANDDPSWKGMLEQQTREERENERIDRLKPGRTVREVPQARQSQDVAPPAQGPGGRQGAQGLRESKPIEREQDRLPPTPTRNPQQGRSSQTRSTPLTPMPPLPTQRSRFVPNYVQRAADYRERSQFLKFGALPEGFEFVPGHRGLLGSAQAVAAGGMMPLGGGSGQSSGGSGQSSGGSGQSSGGSGQSSGGAVPSTGEPLVGELAEIRARQAQEMQDPRVRAAVFARMEIEVGSQNTRAQQAWLESMQNRAASRGLSLYDAVSNTSRHRYYPTTDDSRWRQMAASAQTHERLAGKFLNISQAVSAGSNISNFATGNASGDVGFGRGPAVRVNGRMVAPNQTADFDGERYGIERRDEGWARTMRRKEQEARERRERERQQQNTPGQAQPQTSPAATSTPQTPQELATATNTTPRTAAQTIAAAISNSGNSISPRAIDIAAQTLGLHERTNRQQLISYLRSGGQNIDPAATAWCSAFVNASLAKAGIRGTGDFNAANWQRWGKAVEDYNKMRKGDVLVEHRGVQPGVAGAHVGMATGRRRVVSGRVQFEMLGGNQRNAVTKKWVDASQLKIRRAVGDKQPLPEYLRAAAELQKMRNRTPTQTAPPPAAPQARLARSTDGNLNEQGQELSYDESTTQRIKELEQYRDTIQADNDYTGATQEEIDSGKKFVAEQIRLTNEKIAKLKSRAPRVIENFAPPSEEPPVPINMSAEVGNGPASTQIDTRIAMLTNLGITPQAGDRGINSESKPIDREAARARFAGEAMRARALTRNQRAESRIATAALLSPEWNKFEEEQAPNPEFAGMNRTTRNHEILQGLRNVDVVTEMYDTTQQPPPQPQPPQPPPPQPPNATNAALAMADNEATVQLAEKEREREREIRTSADVRGNNQQLPRGPNFESRPPSPGSQGLGSFGRCYV